MNAVRLRRAELLAASAFAGGRQHVVDPDSTWIFANGPFKPQDRFLVTGRLEMPGRDSDRPKKVQAVTGGQRSRDLQTFDRFRMFPG